MQPLSGGESLITRESTKELRDDRLNRNPFVAGRAYEVIADSDGIVRLRTGDRVRGVMVVESPFLCSASVAYQKNGIATIRLTREWEFLERKEVPANITNFDFDVQLRGSDDYELFLESYWLHGNESGPEILWRVNGNGSAGFSNCHSSFTFRGGAGGTRAGLLIARSGAAANTEHRCNSNFLLGKDQNRLCYGFDNLTWATTATQTNNRHICGKWEDTTTVITSVGVVCTVADNILAGSWFDLYRRPQFDKTKLTLWVY